MICHDYTICHAQKMLLLLYTYLEALDKIMGSSGKALGVFFDSSLKFDKRLQNLASKAFGKSETLALP